MIDALGQIVHQYISIPPASDTISPAFVGSMAIESMWVVSQWAGDFNPFHIHQGELSGVIYLRVPPSLKDEYAKEDHLSMCWRYCLACWSSCTLVVINIKQLLK